MSLDIYFDSDIINCLAALALANARALAWAHQFGADPRDLAIVKAAYQAALADVGISFGLHRVELLIIFNEKTLGIWKTPRV